MKPILLRTKFVLLATASSIGLATTAQAVVTWVVSEDGTGMTMTTSGSLQTISTNTGTGTDPPVGLVSGSAVYSINGAFGVDNTTGSGTDTSFAGNIATQTFGHSFGHNGDTLIWDLSFGNLPDTFFPVSEMTFAGATISGFFGTSLNSGPVTVWTDNTTSDTIQVELAVPVPEPTAATLAVLGLLGLVLRHRKG